MRAWTMFNHKVTVLGLLLLFSGLFMAWPHAASAQYVENNLIDDNMFLNATSMNQSQIQTFLSGRGGYLARYSAYSNRDSATVPASQIIYEAAQDYGVNPQAIMAMLQKEQSLVTATNPTSSQLNFAMGYGCPDSSGCGTTYLGFYSQVDNATWQLRLNFERARGNNTWWNSSYSYVCRGTTRYYSTGLYVGRNVTFYDDYGTAYKTFTINDAATAALYCYTPHAYPGSSAEYYSGSYNFVTAFESWFGSTQPGVTINSSVSAGPSANYYTGMPITASATFRNTTSAPIDIGTFTVAVRDQSQNNYDFPLRHIVVPANGTYTYQETQNFSQAGTYTFDVGDYRDGYGWVNSYPVSSLISNPRSGSFQVQAAPTITTGLAVSPSNPRVGQDYTTSFSVKNNDASPVNLGTLFVAMRDTQNANWDLPPDTNVVVTPGATYAYTKTSHFTQPGTYTMTLSNWRDGAGWNDTFPQSDNNVSRSVTLNVLPSPTVIQGLSGSTSDLHVGQMNTLSFQIKNYGSTAIQPGKVGLALRDPQGNNRDPRWDTPTINPGQTYTYSVDIMPDQTGVWSAAIGNYQDAVGWNSSLPVSENSAISRSLTFNVAPSATVTSGLTLSPAQVYAGDPVNTTFTVTNFSNTPVSIGKMGVAVRDAKDNNLDIGYDDNVTIAANSTYTFTKSAVFTNASQLRLSIANYQSSLGWNDTSPALDSSSVVRAITVPVMANPTMTTSLTSSSASPRVGQTTTLSFQITNHGSAPVQPGKIGVSVRDPSGENDDPRWDMPSIAPGQTYTYSVNVPLTKIGNWTVEIGNYQDALGWNGIYPASDSTQIIRKLTLNVTS